MDARVTKHCPNFFEKYVTFNTNVKLVTYDDTTEIFTATIENLQTGEVLSNMGCWCKYNTIHATKYNEGIRWL